MADHTIRGEGLDRLHTALGALQREVDEFGYTRSRFDGSPPPYYSDRSGTATRSHSPSAVNEERQTRQEIRDRLRDKRRASTAYAQFHLQRDEEERRVIEARRKGTEPARVGVDYYDIAYDNVKSQWVSQGLWNDRWHKMLLGRWKHEEPLDCESQYETDPEASAHLLFGGGRKVKRLKSEDARRRIAEHRATIERKREASRPYHQFVYQMSQERDRVHNHSAGDVGKYRDDINTTAYENIKKKWHERQLWDESWGIMPGMSWAHEKPWDEATAELGVQTPVSHTPPTRSVGTLPAQIRTSAPVCSNPRPQPRYSLFGTSPPPIAVNGESVPDTADPISHLSLFGLNTRVPENEDVGMSHAQASDSDQPLSSILQPLASTTHVQQSSQSNGLRPDRYLQAQAETGVDADVSTSPVQPARKPKKVAKAKARGRRLASEIDQRDVNNNLNVTNKTAITQSNQPRRSARLKASAEPDAGSPPALKQGTGRGRQRAASPAKPRGVTKKRKGKQPPPKPKSKRKSR